MPIALFWRRLDTPGAEHTLFSDRAGLRARGTLVVATPVPHTCRYELVTDDGWTTTRCDVAVDGAGFARAVRLERAAGRWRVTATEQGNLDAALLAVGAAPTDASLDVAEHAAWTSICLAILNLDEALTRE